MFLNLIFAISKSALQVYSHSAFIIISLFDRWFIRFYLFPPVSPFLTTPGSLVSRYSVFQTKESRAALALSRAAFIVVGHWRFALVNVKLAITFL